MKKIVLTAFITAFTVAITSAQQKTESKPVKPVATEASQGNAPAKPGSVRPLATENAKSQTVAKPGATPVRSGSFIENPNNNQEDASSSLSIEQKRKMKALAAEQKQEIEELKQSGVSDEKIEAVRQKQIKEMQSLVNDQKAEANPKKETILREEVKKEKTTETATTATTNAPANTAATAGNRKVQEETVAAGSADDIKAKIKAVQQDATLTDEQKQAKTDELMALLKQATHNSSSATGAKPAKKPGTLLEAK